MKKQSLNTDRISLKRQTDNHYKVTIFNVEFDFSGEELFSVSLRDKNNNLQVVFCRELTPAERHHKGQHFNTLEPSKKKRLPYREWKKAVNTLLQYFRFEQPEVK